MEKPAWIKNKKVAPDFEVIRNPNWSPYRDFDMDKGCYVLIRVYHDLHEIGVAICNYDHTILKEFRGKIAQEIYDAIFKYDRKNEKGWFTKMEHAAYIGKELKKAELALIFGKELKQPEQVLEGIGEYTQE